MQKNQKPCDLVCVMCHEHNVIMIKKINATCNEAKSLALYLSHIMVTRIVLLMNMQLDNILTHELFIVLID